MNTDDNEGAARLFAEGARVVQPGNEVRRLETFAEARSLEQLAAVLGPDPQPDRARGHRASVTFVLGERPNKSATGPASAALALFRVHGGKIVLWHQLEQALQPEEEHV